MPSLNDQIRRRRTFAIISHPDAGKTTLTEKFLLYGGAVQLAGSVTARKHQRATASDWMELERQRGISVSSTLLQFEYDGYVINLLDTPGHKDFSEDTYRVLMAVDSVIMVIDAAKGIESQTRKLFEVCRRRRIPIFTFMNKLDRPAREPLWLLDQLESVLGMQAYAVNWPLASGPDFRGVFDRLTSRMHLFERTPGGAYKAPVQVAGLSDPLVRERIPAHLLDPVVEELEVLTVAGATFDRQAVRRGDLTPVFFGSAANNFGVQLLLDSFLELAPAPGPREAIGRSVPPDLAQFSGFIFKIQANMDPRHRDTLAFVRVCSGQFKRDMTVIHPRTGRRTRLASSHKLFGQDRETIDEAFAGDIIGIVGHSEFRVGDTLTEDGSLIYHGIPPFAPECFAYLHAGTAQAKQFREGLGQLEREGVIQLFHDPDEARRVSILGAVGALQFDVAQYRLQTEYNVETRLEPAPWTVLRWVSPEVSGNQLRELILPGGVKLARDASDNAVLLFPNDWTLRYFASKHPEIPLQEIPFGRDLPDGPTATAGPPVAQAAHMASDSR
ncbi:MAG TPA: peptide chain release factor 3 [Phycisphaerae bacterium]|jgi:peptide chain release factor 3|nr:peptide chain release factor 3 [Phycisphaerae bacterium]HOB73418.1 peptide chain release factor 3 [Phycisphaerae bacterium]HOL25060.1 peptide chain release factor 3 [Phycisphaerae bacterium]HPP21361.1 peptide chain release factor 3 [Phycisphaerae bacterium]HPU33474.1 peptide chain release factor 3 [Phycisphaerae bacterium]